MASSSKKDERKKKLAELQRKKRRTLHEKHRERRKDMIVKMPFIIGYQGDPAMGIAYMYCDQVRTFKLIAPKVDKTFARLRKYAMKPIKSLFKVKGKILVKEAPNR